MDSPLAIFTQKQPLYQNVLGSRFCLNDLFDNLRDRFRSPYSIPSTTVSSIVADDGKIIVDRVQWVPSALPEYVLGFVRRVLFENLFDYGTFPGATGPSNL